MKHRTLIFLSGLICGIMFFGGTAAVAAGIVAQPSWSPIYVDGRQVSMTAYNIAGNNYVRLRDIGQAVGFNVYWADGVQVDSTAPYTGEAPAKPIAAGSISVSSYKGGILKAGDRSGLIISPSGAAYTMTSSNPTIVTVEKLSGNWVAVAKAAGTATITASDSTGSTGSLTLTVEDTASTSGTPNPASGGIDLNANMEIRQEMIRLINQVRREHGVAELAINTELMNAAQDCSAQMFTDHNSEYECGAVKRYGYPYGFGDNLTWFTGSDRLEHAASTAVRNWINSHFHFQTMIDPSSDTIGVGITIRNGKACCYMFAGIPNSCSAYG